MPKIEHHGVPLTIMEKRIVRALADGKGLEEIALEVHYSRRTVVNHLNNARNKLNTRKTVHLIATALRAGIIE